MLIDVVSFDGLDVAKKRALFMRMSDQDYSYAVKYYKKLTESARDLQGSIKKDKEKLVKENDKLLSREDEARIRSEIESIRLTLSDMLESRGPKIKSLSDHRVAMDKSTIEFIEATMRLEKLIETVKSDLDRLFDDKPSKGSKDADVSLSETIKKLETRNRRRGEELSSLQALISEACKHLERLEKSRSSAMDQSQQKLDYLKSLAEETGKSIEKMRSKLLIEVTYSDPKGASEQLKLALDALEALSTYKDEIQKPDESSPEYQEMELELRHLGDKLKHVEDLLSENEKKIHTLDHYRSRGVTECPSCHHSWIPNYDPNQAHLLEGERAGLQKSRLVCEERLEYLNRQITIQRQLMDYRKRFQEILRSYPALKPLFHYLHKKYDWMLKTPFDLLAASDKWLADIRYAPIEMGDHLTIQSSEEKLSRIVKEMSEHSGAEPVDITLIDREIGEITETLHQNQSRHRTVQSELHRDRQLHSTLTTIASLCSRIVQMHQSGETALKEEISHHIACLIDEVIMMHNVKLTSLERSLTTIDIQKGIVSSLEKSIEEKESDLKLLKMAIAALSPTEGLIAKGMGGFINRFVADNNKFIENFWLYPLTLEPVDITGDEIDLDYKFMVRINSTHVVDDIKYASRGMREIINLAIRASCMKYLGLRNYPLFLDEFAARMDVAHRKAAYEAIDKLIESDEYSQIFLVSHYQEGYGALTDAEVLVLCDNNVRMPVGLEFNKHVTITTQ